MKRLLCMSLVLLTWVTLSALWKRDPLLSPAQPALASAAAHDARPGDRPSRATASQPVALSRRAYIDAQTGRLLPAPPTDAGRIEPPPPGARLKPEWLLEIRGTSPAGGVKLNLKGRFRHYLKADIAGPGKTHVICTEAGPSPQEHPATDIQ